MNKKHFWKRGIAAACAVVTAATGLALPVFAADTSGLAVTPKVVALGDDCLAEVSGSIDTQDLFLCLYNIARVGAGLDTELNPIQRKALDADNSGTLDSQDIFLWLYYMAQTGAGVHVDLADYLAQNQA